MSIATRDDIHSPVNLVPEDYAFLVAFDNGGNDEDNLGIMEDDGYDHDIDALLTELEHAHRAGRVPYGDAARCDHCGARIRYVGLFRHRPTGDIIAIGQTCASGRLTYSKEEFDRLRRSAALDRQAQRLLVAWNAFRAERPEVAWDDLAASENEFIVDVLRKGRHNGFLSDRQVDAIVTAYGRDLERAARRAEELANALPTTPVPCGSGVTIEGVVLGTKTQESEWGITHKMLVEVTTDGATYKVWGSIPRAIDPDRGDRVRFVANVERSDDDEAFGFYKRPRKAAILEVAA